jgi:hypothetical protein
LFFFLSKDLNFKLYHFLLHLKFNPFPLLDFNLKLGKLIKILTFFNYIPSGANNN